MEELTVIIPIHKYNNEIEVYLNRAIQSVNDQIEKPKNILIVGPEDVLEKINLKSDFVSYLDNKGETDYCSQINLAVKQIKTKLFSILAFDDFYHKTWFKNVKQYIENQPEFSIFLPIVNFVNSQDKVVGMANEIIWAMSFSNEIGVIDEDTLQSYFDFTTNGAVFRTDDFIEVGMLKPSLKLSFWYEFLLRSTNQDIKIFVIPKNGYYQTIDREDSLLKEYQTQMTPQEKMWWVKLAQKEYYFKQERKKEHKYVEEKKLTEVDGLK